jgi:outer membrane protein assembly factor BamB
MRILANAALWALLTATAVSAQAVSHRYATPPVPPQEALDRLNLKLAWHIYLPMDGRRDSIHDMQIIGSQLLIVLRSGAVASLDTSTGALQWLSRVGTPYAPPAGVSANANSVFIAKGARLTALDRTNGTYQWDIALRAAPAAGAAADDERLYVPAGTDMLLAFLLPRAEEVAPPPVAAGERRREPPPAESYSGPPVQPSSGKAASAFGVSGQSVRAVSAVSSKGQALRAVSALSGTTQTVEGITSGAEPRFAWSYETEARTEGRVEQMPLVTQQFVFQAAANGVFFALSKFEPRVFYRFQADAPVSAPLNQYGDIAYVPSQDFRVYAVEIGSGRILWRFIGGGPVVEKPQVTDDSVYVIAERSGLYRLDRIRGEMVWRNVDARHFLAANRKFVYATNQVGALLVLDRATGAPLANYLGTRDFVVPFANDHTDRIYLASNDGLLLCLHDRDYPRPLLVRTVAETAPPPKPAAGTKKPAANETDGDQGEQPAAAPPAKRAPAPKPQPAPKPKGPDEAPDK